LAGITTGATVAFVSDLDPASVWFNSFIFCSTAASAAAWAEAFAVGTLEVKTLSAGTVEAGEAAATLVALAAGATVCVVVTAELESDKGRTAR
jgi:hypothetical protein